MECNIREHIIPCAGEIAVSVIVLLSVPVLVPVPARFVRRLFIFVISESVSVPIVMGRCEPGAAVRGDVVETDKNDARQRLYAAADGRFTCIISQQFTMLLDMKLMLSVTITNDMCMRGLLQRI